MKTINGIGIILIDNHCKLDFSEIENVIEDFLIHHLL